MTHIAFAWPGLPDYAARCIRAVIDRQNAQVTVVATRPNVPIKGMEDSLGQSVHWLDKDETHVSWKGLGSEVPDILFAGGYFTPAFKSLETEVRRRGGRVILMSDNNWQNSFRQWFIDPIRHRLLFRHRYDAIFVPGASSKRLSRNWGYSAQETYTGMYGADPKLFNGGPPLKTREKTFLFIGQFIPRKEVLTLARAFLDIAELCPEWTLRLCGSGAQENDIPKHPQLAVHGFVQPTELAEMLQSARCLMLPSLEEHWGLVVHEAASCGCALGLSQAIGAADDLARPENAIQFRTGDQKQIAQTMLTFASWSDARWDSAERTSRALAAQFGPSAFADAIDDMMRDSSASARS